MGRREKPIEPGQGEVAEFAADLRMLRRRTGGVPYRELASRVPYSASSLSAAASGHRLPAWPVVAAYLEACGVDNEAAWYRRWRQAAGLPPDPAAGPPRGAGAGRHAGPGARPGPGDPYGSGGGPGPGTATAPGPEAGAGPGGPRAGSARGPSPGTASGAPRTPGAGPSPGSGAGPSYGAGAGAPPGAAADRSLGRGGGPYGAGAGGARGPSAGPPPSGGRDGGRGPDAGPSSGRGDAAGRGPASGRSSGGAGSRAGAPRGAAAGPPPSGAGAGPSRGPGTVPSGPGAGAAGSAEGGVWAPRGVPDPPTRFVGRAREAEDVGRLLAEHRLLTLTGAGGVGKTRLAQRAARSAGLLFRDGACWVELAEVTSPDVLPYAVAEGLGLGPVPPHLTPTDHLVGALHQRELLLVLDNCEHLAAACARLAHLLLDRTTGVRLLTTSRLPLGPGAERLYVVPPLPEDASLALLTDRAALLSEVSWSRDDLEHARAVIRRLDGLPLAIEFAARRLRALSPGQLLDRLDERLPLLSKGDPVAPERHRSLRAMLDWSHQLCTPAQQRLWARLSVFAGSVPLDAAHAVWEEDPGTGGGTAPEELLDAVDGLIDHSLLLTEPGDGAGRRYTMLETVREYGRDRLARGGDLDDARTRHLMWFRDRVLDGHHRWAGPGQAGLLERLRHDLPNIRHAMEYGLRDGAGPAQTHAALDIARGLQWYWTATGTTGEGTGRLRRALAVTAPADDDPVVHAARTRAMAACAFLCVFPADLATAGRLADEAIARALADGDRGAAGWADLVRGLAAETTGRPDVALAHLRASLEHFEAAGEAYGEQQLLSILGSTLWAVGRLEESAACVERGMRIARALGETWHRPYLDWVLALVRITERRLTGPDGALAHARAVLEAQRVFADPRALALGHDALAHCAWLLGRHHDAARLFGASDACWPREETQIVSYRTDPLGTERCEADLRAVLGEEGYALARAEGAQAPPDEAREWSIRFAVDVGK